MNEAVISLEARFPAWQVWYVPRAMGGTIWCARPWAKPDPKHVLNADSPEHLAEYIAEAESA